MAGSTYRINYGGNTNYSHRVDRMFFMRWQVESILKQYKEKGLIQDFGLEQHSKRTTKGNSNYLKVRVQATDPAKLSLFDNIIHSQLNAKKISSES